MPDWLERVQGLWAGIAGRVQAGMGGRRRSAETFTNLRSMALGLDPSSIRSRADEPWNAAAVAAMELSVSGATATIVAVADGTVSMYLSTGGGTLGAGDHAAVRAEAQRFRTVLADARGLLVRTAVFPLPRTGEVRFHARIGEDRFTGVAPEVALRGGRHVLSPVYAAGQDLLTEIRLASEPREG